MTQYRIGLLAFPAMTQLDMTGPLQVFASLPGAEVRVIWKTLDPLSTQGGLRLLPDTTLDDCPKLDVICVPGGTGVMDLMDDEIVLSFLRARAEEATFVGSICTGSLVLGQRDCCADGGRRLIGRGLICWCRWGRSRRLAGWCATASSSLAAG